MLMNQNNTTFKNILIQSLTLSVAITASLLLIIFISNIIIFPIVMFSEKYPLIFTRVVEFALYLGIVVLICYYFIYKIINLRNAGIPVTISIKNAILSPARYILFILMILLFIFTLILIIYVVLKTNYVILYKLMH